MNRNTNPSRQADAPDVDNGRRRALKRLAKAAYVAPAISVLPMEKLMAAASSSGCGHSGGKGNGCNSPLNPFG